MNRLPRDKRNRMLLIAFGTVAVLALIWVFLIQGQLTALRQKQAQAKQAMQKNEEARLLLNRAEEFKAALGEATQRLISIEAGMFSGGIPWVYKTIPKFNEAGHRKVALVDVQSGARYGEVGLVRDFPYQAVTFTIQMNSAYQDFGRFLADFENQFPYFRVQILEIGQAKGAVSGDEDKLDFRLDIVALVKPGSLP
jgi:Tfp pilus assembly protein PilO